MKKIKRTVLNQLVSKEIKRRGWNIDDPLLFIVKYGPICEIIKNVCKKVY